MKTLVSIDWDYFVPEKADHDLGHRESQVFLDTVWRARVGLLDEIGTSGLESGFWERNGMDSTIGDPVYVSDSHACAYTLLRNIGRVVLFDAHHDCWHGDSLGLDLSEDRRIYCHNWLRAWLRGSRKRSVLWVRPEWSRKMFDVPDDLRDRVTVIREPGGWDKSFDRVHVCRSGCWCPPWLDGKFIDFIESSGRRAVPLQGGDWDPMRKRWADGEAEALRGEMDKCIATLSRRP